MLKLPDNKVLMHGASVYDPIKAHEYYLKNRELKGRKKGTAVAPVGRSSSARSSSGSGSVTLTLNGKAYKLTAQQYAEQQAYATMRVKRISDKIHELERALKDKLAKARKNERESKKPDTAAEKAKKANDAQQYRDKHKQQLKNKAAKAAKKTGKEQPNLNTVAGLKTAIADAKNKLSAAVERQRALASATRG